MKVETRRILSAMTGVPNREDVIAAMGALDLGAVVVESTGGVDPKELARTWAGRRAGPFLSPDKHPVVDALLAELDVAGAAPWVLRSIRAVDESFILFIDGTGAGRSCIRWTV